MILDWLTVRDYEREKRAATEQIIQKQSRGSVSAQDGDNMFNEDLKQESRRADESLSRLKKAVARTH